MISAISPSPAPWPPLIVSSSSALSMASLSALKDNAVASALADSKGLCTLSVSSSTANGNSSAVTASESSPAAAMVVSEGMDGLFDDDPPPRVDTAMLLLPSLISPGAILVGCITRGMLDEDVSISSSLPEVGSAAALLAVLRPVMQNGDFCSMSRDVIGGSRCTDVDDVRLLSC